MELINQVTSTQFLLPALAVAGVLVCAVLVFVFGFKTAEEPQFDKLPLVIEDRKSKEKKRKTKEKKSGQDKKGDGGKKSPSKEKKEQKQEPQKVKEKVQEVKKTPTRKEAPATTKKTKVERPVDYDEGEWEKVPSKSDKKKKNQDEVKTTSPVKEKRKGKKEEVEKAPPSAPPANVSAPVKENVAVIDKELQEKIVELQRALNAMEERERSGTPVNLKVAPATSDTDNKKTPEEPPTKKETSKKDKKVEEFVPPPAANEGGAVFDELGDTWTDAKAVKKNKKKVRKDQ